MNQSALIQMHFDEKVNAIVNAKLARIEAEELMNQSEEAAIKFGATNNITAAHRAAFLMKMATLMEQRAAQWQASVEWLSNPDNETEIIGWLFGQTV